MSFNAHTTHLIAEIDRLVNDFLQQGLNKKTIVIRLSPFYSPLKNLLQSADEKQLELYVQAYSGFRHLIQTITTAR